MPDAHQYLLFIAAGLLLNITPGADMLYVVTSAARHGAMRGVIGALGIFTGTLFHIVLAVIGLSAMLAASALAFSIVKYAGAAYLCYLGLVLLLKPSAHARQPTAPTSAGAAALPAALAIFRRGILINVLNPKIALFFLAFLPQFINPSAGDRPLAFAVLGLTFNISGTVVNMIAALSAARLGQLSIARRIGGWAQRGVGVLFVGLGARLAIDGADR